MRRWLARSCQVMVNELHPGASLAGNDSSDASSTTSCGARSGGRSSVLGVVSFAVRAGSFEVVCVCNGSFIVEHPSNFVASTRLWRHVRPDDAINVPSLLFAGRHCVIDQGAPRLPRGATGSLFLSSHG